MFQQERINSLLLAFKNMMRGNQAQIWTAMPCIVESYDAEKQTCTLQVAIKSGVQDIKTGTVTQTQLPILPDVPVQWPSGGDWSQTFPLKKGDEGIAIFACRCIDSWWQSGGVQTQAEQRMHDLSDAMFVPGIRSQARKLTNVSTDQTELRNEDGTIKFATTATGFKVQGTFEVDGVTTLTGNLQLGGQILAQNGAQYAGNLHIGGTVTGDTDVVAGGKSLKAHVHSGVAVGGANTGPNT